MLPRGGALHASATRSGCAPPRASPGAAPSTAFSTTLLYSRYQKHDTHPREIGESVGRDAGSRRFHYRDFRTGWREGVEESKRTGPLPPAILRVHLQRERPVLQRRGTASREGIESSGLEGSGFRSSGTTYTDNFGLLSFPLNPEP
ncbi:MAG: epoxyqueuosine reductase QueH [Desulfomicrobium escambiense]|nr:epoxyqueuosine reductase QueH [Desulfomicrobium escambiense]